MYDFENTTNVIKAIKNVGMYVRLSRAEEGEDDLMRHKNAMIEICERYSWNYVVYAEIGSGESIAKRAKMKELLDDIEDELFDAVIVYDYDRLSRGGGSDQERIMNSLKDSDTLVVTASPFEILNLNNERDEETVEFKGFMARREYKMIRKRMEAGKKISQKMGRWSTGYAPYGYSINSKLKKLNINEEQAKIFRSLIVDPYLNGYSSVEISDELNKRGITTNKGNKWTPRVVLYALKNKAYLGHIYYNRRYRDKKRVGEFKPEEEWSVTENVHPPLITEEEHKQILAIVNTKAGSGEKGVNPLGSMIKCFNCGKAMTIKTSNGEKAVRSCSGCTENRGGHISLVENVIKKTVLLYKEKLESGDHEDDNERSLTAAKEDVARIESEIIKKEKAIEQIQVAFEEGMYTVDKAKERINKRQMELLALNKTLKEKKRALKNLAGFDSQSRIKRLNYFLSELNNAKDTRQLKMMYKELFDEIIWQRNKWDEIKITINFK